MRVTSKGQVTIPRDLREITGIEPNSEVIFGMENGKITIVAGQGDVNAAETVRMKRFLEVLDRLEGTGDQTMNAEDVIAATRGR